MVIPPAEAKRLAAQGHWSRGTKSAPRAVFRAHPYPDGTDGHLPAESRELVVTAVGQGYEFTGFGLTRKTALSNWAIAPDRPPHRAGRVHGKEHRWQK